MSSLTLPRLVTSLALVALSGCASVPISPDRRDIAIVEGQLGFGTDCGTVPRDTGGYWYVCDMPLAVERVVLGDWPESSVVARYFVGESGTEDEIWVGPHLRRDRRGGAILWRREDGLHSYVLMEFVGRWCVPDWMTAELSISTEEMAELAAAGYPLCSVEAAGQPNE